MEKKIALITGASRGLGRSMALHLADDGVEIVGTFRNGATEAAAVAREIESRGERAAMLQLDVARTRSFPDFIDTLKQTLHDTFHRQSIDILINNAGAGMNARIADATEAMFDDLVNMHFKGPFFLTQRLLPLLADGGRIINISSGLTRFTFPGRAAYAANKAAIEVFTRYLATELGPRGITANVIAPGATATDFGGGSVRDNPEVNRQVATTVALGRVGEPDDIGAAVAAIASEAGRWITGERIEVSGGQHL